MAQAKMTGYAVVGLGNLARNAILPAFLRSKNSKVVALVSRDRKKASELSKKFKASAAYGASEYDDCLARSDISAVYVVTPPGCHEEFTVRAAEAGKHVLCEKPLAATVVQSEGMVAACRRNGVLLMTAYRKYFEPSTLYLKSLVKSGALGRIDTIHTSFSEIYNPKITPKWMVDASQAGGGPLMDLGVYCVNTSRWIAGENPIEAVAQSWKHDRRRFANVEEGMTFRLHFPSGLVVQGSSTYSAAMSSFLFVQGSKGWVSLSPAFPYDEVRHLASKIAGRAINRHFQVLDEFVLEIDAFSDAIVKKKPVEPDGVQGHRDMIILNAIYESAKTHKPVKINYSSKKRKHEC
jgi:glucose-fructose oxidoreductase